MQLSRKSRKPLLMLAITMLLLILLAVLGVSTPAHTPSEARISLPISHANPTATP